MPALYAFVACEKIILDKNDVASLISLFTIVTATVPADVPPNAAIPKEWAIFSSWDCEEGDEGKEYIQHVEILHPDGSIFLVVPDAKFTLEPGRKHQILNPVLGLPIGQQGDCKVNMWLEQNGETVFRARPIALQVKHAIPSATVDSPHSRSEV